MKFAWRGQSQSGYLQISDHEEKMATIIIHLIVISSLIFTGCVSVITPPPSTLPTNTLDERIAAVENSLPVKRWSKWNVATLFDRMEHYNVPGVSVAVINNDKIEWAKGYGKLDVEKIKRVTPETLFQAASIGKSLTAAAAMQFVEKGYLNLDENVNEKLVSWKVHENRFTKQEKVTLRRLLSHTAGMSVHGFRGYSKGEKIPTLLQILDGKAPANNKPIRVDIIPGKAFSYSGGGFQIVQQLFEDVQSEPFSDIMREAILIPAGMTSSAYELSLSDDRKNIAAVAHNVNGKPAAGKWHDLACFGAGGGLWTTPADLARFGLEISKAYKGKPTRIISHQSAQIMLTPQNNAGDLGRQVNKYLPEFCSQVKYGLGFILCGQGEDFIFLHPGHNLPGYRDLLVMMPEKEQGISIMVNGENGNGLILEIFYSFARAYRWIRN